MYKKNNGITLIALTITIVVLLIIAGITLTGGSNSVKMANEEKLLAELEIVHHACLERYTEYKITHDSTLLVGNNSAEIYNEAQDIAHEMDGVTLPQENNPQYYKLGPEDLQAIGLMQSEDTYIVNYEKGIVMNATTKTTYTGKALFKQTY